MERMKNPKLIAALVVAALACVVFFQNRETISVVVLFFTVTTSRASALGLSFLTGVLVGFLAFSRWHSQRNKAAKATDKPAA